MIKDYKKGMKHEKENEKLNLKKKIMNNDKL